MKFYLKLIYCMMEAAIDCSAWMRKGHCQRRCASLQLGPKVVVLCGTLFYGITPLVSLAVFAPLTNR